VYRCKGIVQLAEAPDERTVLQAVGRRTSLSPLGPWKGREPLTDVVVIGAEGSLDHVALRAAFDTCRSSPHPTTPI
jgi:G3E family GTPase